MIKIAHLADLHIRLHSRFDEYEQVFNRTIENLQEQKPDIIYLGGDIFHSKINLSPEAVDIASKFLRDCANIAYTIVIIGNHDASLKSKNSRLDALTPLINLTLGTKYVLKISVDSEIIGYNNKLNFFHYSCKDDKTFTDEELNTKGVKICLHHGMVIGSKNNSGKVFDRSDRDNIPFEKFNLTLLGDIHKLQTINSNIFYPSSLICQDFGEHPIEHGYLIHKIGDNQTITSEFIPIKNEYAHFTFNAVGNKIDYKKYKKDVTNKSRVRILYNSLSAKDEVVKNFREDFPELTNVTFEDIETIVTNTSDLSMDVKKIDVLSLEFQEEQFKKYFENEDEESLAEILALNRKLYNDVVSSKNLKFNSTSFSLNKLTFNNTFSYGENNSIDFDKYKGVIGLFSKNGSGKSAFLDTIPVALFGDYPFMSSVSSIINNNEKEASTEIELTINNKPSIISRTIKRLGKSKSTSDISFTIDNVNLTEDVMGTKNNIKENIGSLDDYTRTAYISQKSPDLFLNMKNSERKEWMTQNLGLKIYEYLHESAKLDSKELANEVSYLLKTDWQTEQVKYLTDNKELEQKLKIVESQLKTLDDSLNSVDENIKTLAKNIVTEKEKIIPNITMVSDNDIISTKNSITSAQNKIQQIKDGESNSIELKKEYFKTKKQDLEDSISNLKSKTYYDESIINNINNKIDSLKSDGVELNNKITEIINEFGITELMYDVEPLDKIVNEATKEYESLLSSYTDYKNEIKELQSRLKQSEEQTQILSEDTRFKNESICSTCPLLKNAFDIESHIPQYRIKLLNLKDILIELFGSDDTSIIDEILSNKKHDLKLKNSLITKFEKYVSERENLLKNFKALKNDLKLAKENDASNKELFLESYEQQLASLKEKIDTEIDNFKSTNNYSIKLLTEQIKSFENTLQLQLQQFDDAKKNIEYKNSISMLERQINQNESVKDTIEAELQIINDKIHDLKYSIRYNNDKVDEIDKTILILKSKQNEYSKYEKYITSTHKNNIPTKIVDNIIQTLENEVNIILSKLGEYRIELQNEEKSLNCLVSHTIKGELNSDRLCGMESFIVNLAIRIAMTKISNTPIANFLIIDEGFSALDSDNIQAVPALFDFLKSKFDFILVVSHDVFMRDFVDYNFEIEILDNKSNIVV